MKIKKILIIDDDKDLAHLIRDFLYEKGFNVFVAYDGSEGLEMCKNERPDLIMLDLLMPKIDGVKFLEVLQKDPEMAVIPIVIISVVADKTEKEKGRFHLGIVDWLKKPIDFDELAKVIKDSENLLHDQVKQKKKIIVIEDDSTVSETMSILLESQGYEPAIFSSTSNIVENVVKEKPFLLMIDLLMGETDGIEIIRQLKDNPLTMDIPVVVVSSIDIYEHRKKCLLAGATEYYVGSFSSESFLSELQNNIMKYEMAETQRYAKILVADDDYDLARITMDNVKVEGFEVIYAKDGEEAVKLTYKEMPDLILLDINMPRKDGYQAFREIKSDILLTTIPIIMLTAKAKTREKILGLNLGADDYITKPYDLDELIARVKMVLRRTTSNRELNPLTRLPGNVAVEQTLNDCIRNGKPFAVLYVDINNFKSYNDYYGFSRGDEVIRSTARSILESINELGCREDFVGHIGGDDFIIVTNTERVDILCGRVISKFDAIAPSFYDTFDREKGYITVKDRRGNILNSPLVSVAIGVATTKYKKLGSVGVVAKIGAEMKSYAKKFKDRGSHYSIDERRM
ncbi:MAG: response regulator [Candidatus Firestonebacteria bacterium]